MHCIQTAEDIVKLLSHTGSPIILVFFLTRYPIPSETPSARAQNTRKWKFCCCDFRLKLPSISETVHDRPMVATKRLAAAGRTSGQNCSHASVKVLPTFTGASESLNNRINDVKFRRRTDGRPFYASWLDDCIYGLDGAGTERSGSAGTAHEARTSEEFL